MSSTFLSLHYHIVFSTKNRFPFIHSDWKPRLHEYIGGIIRGMDGVPECIGGMADHVHLLIGLKSTHCLADLVRELKKQSTEWIRTEIGQRKFEWQEGYAAFTVSATSRDAVKHYIANQDEHHRIKPFQDEVVEMLKNAGVEFNVKYLS